MALDVPAGYIDEYSPPGPNLTTGSILPLRCPSMAIFSTLSAYSCLSIQHVSLSAPDAWQPKQKPNKSPPMRALFPSSRMARTSRK
jgi:hypothetical protein